MRKYLNNNINTIFIILGHSCNLQCKYCLQHDVVNIQLETKINDDIIDFILDIANNQKQHLTVQFYGGEPLIYFKSIMYIVNSIKKIGKPSNLSYTMITNGKLINDDNIKFLNENLSGICISWDGRNSNITRGFNVFEINKENIFKLKHFSISGVLSSYNYINDYLDDCAELNKDYVNNYKGKTLSFNVDDLLDVNLQNVDLKQFDYKKIVVQMSQICNHYYDFFVNHQPISIIEKNYVESKINQIKSSLKFHYTEPIKDRCGNGYEVLNLDLNGNLYKCHNTNDIVGTIYDNYFHVMKKVVDMDKVNEHAEICNSCPIQLLCMNGCPLVKDDARQEYYCNAKISMNQPIIDLIYALKSNCDGEDK